MLWSLLSSAYVIYLYRKLNAEREPTAELKKSDENQLDAELARLNERIASLESRLAKTATGGSAS
jgi:hypothetical protein